MYNKTEKKTYEHQRNGMDFAGRLREITIQVSGFHLSTIFFQSSWNLTTPTAPRASYMDAKLCIEK
jgi:hypothetical protein